MSDSTVPAESAEEPPQRSWLAIFDGRSGDRVIAAIVVAFCLLMFFRGITVWQFNDTESAITIEEAESISEGYHRWGLLEYTHHPIGRAYLLIPLVLLGTEPLIVLPIAVSVAAAALALLALLYQASGFAMRSYVLILFFSLLWQPGFVGWLGNLHQHSYNMASILMIIAIGASLNRVTLVFSLLGFVSGWIGYDFFILQIFTAATVRMAFVGRDPRIPPWMAIIRAAGETAAFGAAFLFAVLLHFIQNTLYFSSASMAYWDLYGSLGHRVTFPFHERFDAAIYLTGLYASAFTNPLERWTNPPLLWATLSVLTAASVYTAVRMTRGVGVRTIAERRWWLLPLCTVGAAATVFGWFFAAPRHAGPHLHLFPRMLFVPILVFSAAMVLVLARPDARHQRRGILGPVIALVICGFLCLALVDLPARTHAAVDRRFFDSAWIIPTADLRTDMISSPLLESEPTASSIAPRTSLAGPVTLKSSHVLVGEINFWGERFDLDPTAHWSPNESAAGEAWFEQRFERRSEVTDIALRFWGLPKKRGAHTPTAFQIQALAAEGESPSVAIAGYPQGAGRITRLGKYLCVHFYFSPPVGCDGVRVVIGPTVGGGPPIMTDFLSFGMPSRNPGDSLPDPDTDDPLDPENTGQLRSPKG